MGRAKMLNKSQSLTKEIVLQVIQGLVSSRSYQWSSTEVEAEHFDLYINIKLTVQKAPNITSKEEQCVLEALKVLQSRLQMHFTLSRMKNEYSTKYIVLEATEILIFLWIFCSREDLHKLNIYMYVFPLVNFSNHGLALITFAMDAKA